MYRRKHDQAVAELLNLEPESGIAGLIFFYRKILQLKKDGWRITAYREQGCIQKFQDITLI